MPKMPSLMCHYHGNEIHVSLIFTWPFQKYHCILKHIHVLIQGTKRHKMAIIPTIISAKDKIHIII